MDIDEGMFDEAEFDATVEDVVAMRRVIAEAEPRGYARGVQAAIDVLRGYRGSVQAESAVSDVKRLLKPQGEK